VSNVAVAAAERVAFRRTGIDGDGEVVDARLTVVLNLHAEGAWRAVRLAGPSEGRRVAVDREGIERHAVHLGLGGVVDVLQLAVDRPVGGLALDVEAEGRDAAGYVDGASTGHLARRWTWRGSDAGDLHDERVAADAADADAPAAEDRLEGSGRRWEIGRLGIPGDIRIARGVEGETGAHVEVAASEVRRVQKRSGAGRIQRRDEGVIVTAGGDLDGPRRGREIDGGGIPRHVGVAAGVDGDRDAGVVAGAREVCGVHQGGSGGIDLRHERIEAAQGAAAEGRLEGAGGRREIGRLRPARHVGIAAGVNGDSQTRIEEGAAELRPVAE